MTRFIDTLAVSAYESEYLHRLMYKLEENYCANISDSNSGLNLSKKEIADILRFADILCRSSDVKHKNLSLKIVSLLHEFEELSSKVFVKMSFTNVLVKLGNFPSLNMLDKLENKDKKAEDEDKYTGVDEIDIDLLIKRIANESPLGILFTDGQLKVFNEIKDRNHYSFSGSTSFGKSFIFEAFTKYLIGTNNPSVNIAFIVPTKALINQVSQKIKKIIKTTNYKIVNTPKIPKIFWDNKYIFIFTPERLISYLLDTENPQIDYLFVDEAHKLLNKTDTRTPLMYHALMMANRKSIKIYFASPNIPNPSVFLKLVNKSTDESTVIEETAVSQNRFFIDCHEDKIIMLSDHGKDIVLPKLGFTGEIPKDLKTILEAFSKDKQSIVYCNTIDKTIHTALNYANTLKDVADPRLESLVKISYCNHQAILFN